MRKYLVLAIGIVCMVASFIWMVLSQASTGPFMVLAAISGALIVEGIHQVRKP